MGFPGYLHLLYMLASVCDPGNCCSSDSSVSTSAQLLPTANITASAFTTECYFGIPTFISFWFAMFRCLPFIYFWLPSVAQDSLHNRADSSFYVRTYTCSKCDIIWRTMFLHNLLWLNWLFFNCWWHVLIKGGFDSF